MPLKFKLTKSLLLCVAGMLLCVQFTTLFHLTHHEKEQKQKQTPSKIKAFDKRTNDELKHLLPENRTNNLLPRLLVFVFPQFHQDAINDRIWGRGFTGWDNLRRAPSRNRLGQPIPRPTELGYYDYTDLAPRKRHGELAKEYGIDGLVFHHYWFYDKEYPGPNLHRPLENMLSDGHPNVSFALHWCNKEWTNTWNGKEGSEYQSRAESDEDVIDGLLQPQFYPAFKNETIDHYNFLRRFCLHPNYIKVKGKTLLMIHSKNAAVFKIFTWFRELAIEDGFVGLYFTIGVTKPHFHLSNTDDIDKLELKRYKREAGRSIGWPKANKVLSYPNPNSWGNNSVMRLPTWCVKDTPGEKFNVKRLFDIPGIIISFDNTPRRAFNQSVIFSTGKPADIVETFRKNLHVALYYEACCFPHDLNSIKARKKQDDDRFVILNAMNEWEEAMSLEPSDVFGYRFLETIRDTKMLINERGCYMM